MYRVGKFRPGNRSPLQPSCVCSPPLSGLLPSAGCRRSSVISGRRGRISGEIEGWRTAAAATCGLSRRASTPRSPPSPPSSSLLWYRGTSLPSPPLSTARSPSTIRDFFWLGSERRASQFVWMMSPSS